MKQKYTYLFSIILLGFLVNLTSCGPSSQMFAVDNSNNSDGIYSTKTKQAGTYEFAYGNDIENIAGDPTLGLDYKTDSSYSAYMNSKYLNDETNAAYYNVDTSNIYYNEDSSKSGYVSNSVSESNTNYYGSAGFSPYGMSFGLGMSFGGYPGYGYGGYPGYGYGGYPGYGYGGYPGYGYGGYPGYGYGGYPGYGYGGYPGYGYPGYGYPGGEHGSALTREKRNSQGGNYNSSGYNNKIKYDYKRKSSVATSDRKANTGNSKNYSKYRSGTTRSSSSRTRNEYSRSNSSSPSNSNYNRSNSSTRSYTPTYNSSSRSSSPSRSSSSGARKR
ncbi:MAG: hypothetical protein KAH10_00490 [Flavobacteriales bacterium]|nr:hypothetical protein [Flavobacteriales bacterium]